MFTVAWHPKLIALFLWMVVRYSKDKIVLTAAYEVRDKPSVHYVNPLRGLDIRSWVFKHPQEIVDDINAHWTYDFNRPNKKVAMLHNVGKGEHIHLQVHEKTEYRE